VKSLARRCISKVDNGGKSGSGAPGHMKYEAEDLADMMNEEFPILLSSNRYQITHDLKPSYYETIEQLKRE
jgi:hypothetical protein